MLLYSATCSGSRTRRPRIESYVQGAMALTNLYAFPWSDASRSRRGQLGSGEWILCQNLRAFMRTLALIIRRPISRRPWRRSVELSSRSPSRVPGRRRHICRGHWYYFTAVFLLMCHHLYTSTFRKAKNIQHQAMLGISLSYCSIGLTTNSSITYLLAHLNSLS